jgi:hypothetical protein
MDLSVEAVVNTALALKGATAQQDQQMLLLRKTLDMQTQTVTALLESAKPRLATHGMVGTQLHTTA